MSDGTGGGGQSAAADAIAAAAGGGQQGTQPQGQQPGGDQSQQQQEPSWQQKYLPADMAGTETLAVYKTLPDAMKGLIETKAWASGRVAVPKAGDDAAFQEFAAKVRPAEAKDYTILGPDGKESPTGEAFRATFHELGLHPTQAQKLTEKFNQYQTDEISRITQAGRDEITAVEMELGPQAYNMRLAATGNMLKAAGIEIDAIVPALEQVGGAGKAMRALFALAEKTGELAKVDGATVAMQMGTMTPEAAQKELDSMSYDTSMPAKLADPNSPESQRRKQLMAVVAGARAKGR